MISTTVSGHEACPVEYINAEGSLPVCDSNWDSSFFTQLSQEKEQEEDDDDQGEEIRLQKIIKFGFEVQLTYASKNMVIQPFYKELRSHKKARIHYY